MTPERPSLKNPPSGAPSEPETQALTAEQLAALNDSVKQEEYRREYLAQLQRRACPGGGDTTDSF